MHGRRDRSQKHSQFGNGVEGVGKKFVRTLGNLTTVPPELLYVSVYVLRASRDWLPLIAYSNFMCILHDKLPEKYAATFEAPLQPPSSQSCLFELAAAALRICFLAARSASQQLLIIDFWALILRESRQRKIYR